MCRSGHWISRCDSRRLPITGIRSSSARDRRVRIPENSIATGCESCGMRLSVDCPCPLRTLRWHCRHGHGRYVERFRRVLERITTGASPVDLMWYLAVKPRCRTLAYFAGIGAPQGSGGRSLWIQAAPTMTAPDWPCTRQGASSHPPAGTAAATVPTEFFLFVLFFDLRRLHGLREGQRERVAVIARGLAALLHVGLRFQYLRAQHGPPA
jgi:hypothetical protein